MARNFALVLVVMLFGCGDDVVASDPRPLSELTTEQVVELCRDVALDYYLPTPDEVCALRGVVSSANTASCETTREACLMDPPAGREPLACGGSSEDDYEFCDVTVDEYRACYDAFMIASADVYARADCALAGTDDAPNPGDDERTPPECSRLVARCPAAYRPAE